MNLSDYRILSHMSGVEFVAAIAAFPPLITLCQQSSRSLYQWARSLPSARDKVRDLANETSIFAGLLMALHKILKDSAKILKLKTTHTDVKICSNITRQAKVTMRLMNEMLDRLEPLRSNTRCSRMKTSWTRLRWYFHAEDFTKILLSMNSVKTSALLFMALVQLEQSIQECRERALAGHEIPQDLRDQVSVKPAHPPKL